MATFSVADLTAKNKKTMSKNDKKVIEKYKITSAYESKKTSNGKNNASNNKKEEKEDKKSNKNPYETITSKTNEEKPVESVTESKEIFQGQPDNTISKEVVKTEIPESGLASVEKESLTSDTFASDSKENMPATLSEENNSSLSDMPEAESIDIEKSIENEEQLSINSKNDIEQNQADSFSPVENFKTDVIFSGENSPVSDAHSNLLKDNLSNEAVKFNDEDHQTDNFASSYAEPEMKEIMQTGDIVPEDGATDADFMVTSPDFGNDESVNITKKEENLAKNDNLLYKESAEKNAIVENDFLIEAEGESSTKYTLENDSSFKNSNFEETDSINNIEEIDTAPISSSPLEPTKEEEELQEDTHQTDFAREESEMDTDSDADNSFIYGEAEPEQFVYYHRKDIRLKFHTGEKRRQLLESIKANGIHEPILVRQGPNDKFEIIAGHNRQDIAQELGIKVPYILLKDIDDDTADQICVDTNLLNRQHNDMLPSELSNMLAVKRKMFTLERLSEEFHIANTTMKAFLKLQDLLPELLYDWVDTKKIGMTVGYTIACADRKQQYDLLNYLKEHNIKSISVKQGKEFSNRGKLPWDVDFLNKVFNNEIDFTNVKPQTKVSMTFKELGKFLDSSELKDPKKSLYNLLAFRKKADTMLADYNMEYSDELLLDALKQYIEKQNLY